MSDSKESKKYPAYAFPGGYPLYYLTTSNDLLCPSCANDEPEDTTLTPGINYESVIQCDECSKDIESAYGEE